MVVGLTGVLGVVRPRGCQEETRSGEDGDDARRMRSEDGKAVKAKDWNRLKKDRPPPGTWAGG